MLELVENLLFAVAMDVVHRCPPVLEAGEELLTGCYYAMIVISEWYFPPLTRTLAYCEAFEAGLIEDAARQREIAHDWSVVDSDGI